MTFPRERRFRLLLALWFLAFSCLALGAQSKAPQVYVLHLDDTIQPISADYLARGIHEASRAHAEALLVEMNTPGGLLASTRVMVHDILSSPVPVIFYIAPTGSRAGSAGFFLLEAADVAAMAPELRTPFSKGGRWARRSRKKSPMTRWPSCAPT